MINFVNHMHNIQTGNEERLVQGNTGKKRSAISQESSSNLLSASIESATGIHNLDAVAPPSSTPVPSPPIRLWALVLEGHIYQQTTSSTKKGVGIYLVAAQQWTKIDQAGPCNRSTTTKKSKLLARKLLYIIVAASRGDNSGPHAEIPETSFPRPE
jgi:hypothetical protein